MPAPFRGPYGRPCYEAMGRVSPVTFPRKGSPPYQHRPVLNKLSRIRKSIGEHPLAVASGVNKSNIKNISEYANYALVASSITNYQDELIVSDKLKELMNEVS